MRRDSKENTNNSYDAKFFNKLFESLNEPNYNNTYKNCKKLMKAALECKIEDRFIAYLINQAELEYKKDFGYSRLTVSNWIKPFSKDDFDKIKATCISALTNIFCRNLSNQNLDNKSFSNLNEIHKSKILLLLEQSVESNSDILKAKAVLDILKLSALPNTPLIETDNILCNQGMVTSYRLSIMQDNTDAFNPFDYCKLISKILEFESQNSLKNLNILNSTLLSSSLDFNYSVTKIPEIFSKSKTTSTDSNSGIDGDKLSIRQVYFSIMKNIMKTLICIDKLEDLGVQQKNQLQQQFSHLSTVLEKNLDNMEVSKICYDTFLEISNFDVYDYQMSLVDSIDRAFDSSVDEHSKISSCKIFVQIILNKQTLEENFKNKIFKFLIDNLNKGDFSFSGNATLAKLSMIDNKVKLNILEGILSISKKQILPKNVVQSLIAFSNNHTNAQFLKIYYEIFDVIVFQNTENKISKEDVAKIIEIAEQNLRENKNDTTDIKNTSIAFLNKLADKYTITQTCINALKDTAKGLNLDLHVNAAHVLKTIFISSINNKSDTKELQGILIALDEALLKKHLTSKVIEFLCEISKVSRMSMSILKHLVDIWKDLDLSSDNCAISNNIVDILIQHTSKTLDIQRSNNTKKVLDLELKPQLAKDISLILNEALVNNIILYDKLEEAKALEYISMYTKLPKYASDKINIGTMKILTGIFFNNDFSSSDAILPHLLRTLYFSAKKLNIHNLDILKKIEQISLNGVQSQQIISKVIQSEKRLDTMHFFSDKGNSNSQDQIQSVTKLISEECKEVCTKIIDETVVGIYYVYTELEKAQSSTASDYKALLTNLHECTKNLGLNDANNTADTLYVNFIEALILSKICEKNALSPNFMTTKPIDFQSHFYDVSLDMYESVIEKIITTYRNNFTEETKTRIKSFNSLISNSMDNYKLILEFINPSGKKIEMPDKIDADNAEQKSFYSFIATIDYLLIWYRALNTIVKIDLYLFQSINLKAISITNSINGYAPTTIKQEPEVLVKEIQELLEKSCVFLNKIKILDIKEINEKSLLLIEKIQSFCSNYLPIFQTQGIGLSGAFLENNNLDIKEFLIEVNRFGLSIAKNISTDIGGFKSVLKQLKLMESFADIILIIHENVKFNQYQKCFIEKLFEISKIYNHPDKSKIFSDLEQEHYIYKKDVWNNFLGEQCNIVQNAFKKWMFPFYNLLPQDETNSLTDWYEKLITSFKTQTSIGYHELHGKKDVIYKQKFHFKAKDYPSFYTWKYEDYPVEISAILSGKEVLLKSFSSYKFNAVRNINLDLRVISTNSTLNEKLQEELKHFKIELNHLGYSEYRIKNKTYQIYSPPTKLVFSFDDKDKTNKVENNNYNATSANSPFAIFMIKIIGDSNSFNHTSKINSLLKLVEKLVGTLQIELFGEAYCVHPNKLPTNEFNPEEHYPMMGALEDKIDYYEQD
jgi:hypothetical protein